MVAGLASAGVDVVRLGVVPTPGVAFLTADSDADLGVMLSASHNPMPDNGIKFFARGGTKLDDALEDAIESRMREQWARPTGAGVGRVTDDGSRVEDYVSHLVNSLSRPVSLEGLKVVVDCANGAAYVAAPGGARGPGGRGGPDPRRPRTASTSTTTAARPTWTRCARPWSPSGPTWASPWTATRTAAWPWTPTGRIVDGDQILAILALAMHEAGRLQERHRGGHGDEQPRLRPGDAGGRDHGRADPGRRPLRAGGDEGRRVLPRRRAVRARGDDRARHHRRRGADRAAPDEPDGRDPDQPGRPGRR